MENQCCEFKKKCLEGWNIGGILDTHFVLFDDQRNYFRKKFPSIKLIPCKDSLLEKLAGGRSSIHSCSFVGLIDRHVSCDCGDCSQNPNPLHQSYQSHQRWTVTGSLRNIFFKVNLSQQNDKDAEVYIDGETDEQTQRQILNWITYGDATDFLLKNELIMNYCSNVKICTVFIMLVSENYLEENLELKGDQLIYDKNKMVRIDDAIGLLKLLGDINNINKLVEQDRALYETRIYDNRKKIIFDDKIASQKFYLFVLVGILFFLCLIIFSFIFYVVLGSIFTGVGSGLAVSISSFLYQSVGFSGIFAIYAASLFLFIMFIGIAPRLIYNFYKNSTQQEQRKQCDLS